MKNSIADHTARILLSIDAVRFNAQKPFRYTSGILSPIYCDIRLVMSYPQAREKVTAFLIKLIDQKIGRKNIDVISGTATAAVPLASWVSYQLKLPMIYVRSNQKEHGLENKIEGTFTNGKKVLVVEDIISTGKSSVNNIAAVRDAGGVVNHCLTVSSYNLPLALSLFQKESVTLHTLATMPDVINLAVAQKVITSKDKEIINAWLHSPTTWAKTHGFE